jgi:methionyl-tRNA formyltransferase
MLMGEGLDTGDMLVKNTVQIGENENYEELYARLAQLGAQTLEETIAQIENGSLSPEKQDDSLSCYSPMIRKEMSALDFSKTAREMHNTIRGVTGFTMLGGKRLKIFRSELSDKTAPNAENGEIVDADSFSVKCGDGRVITFNNIQLEGSKRMDTQVFLRGRKLTKGEILG